MREAGLRDPLLSKLAPWRLSYKAYVLFVEMSHKELWGVESTFATATYQKIINWFRGNQLMTELE